MGDSVKTTTLMALLYFWLCQGPWDPVQAEDLPKPSIRADPGPMVTNGSALTIWCQGSPQPAVYGLYKERGAEPWLTSTPQDPRNKTSFLIESTRSQHAGIYQCAYYRAGAMWSERSDPLTLVVTGVYGAPSLSARPSLVVASGGNVSLSCRSQYTSGTFHLLKEGGADPPRHMESKPRASAGGWWALFAVGPVSASHGGTYRCYGSSRSYPYVWSEPSDLLHIEVTGVHREPSLLAQPGSLVLPGDSLTLQCRSDGGFDRFALTKDQRLTAPQRLDGQHSPGFPLGPVNRDHGGQYRCYSGHNLSYVWSAPSAPLDILVAGMYPKPSLSAQPGPSVPWGADVTLQCASETRFDTFYLQKEGPLDPPQHLRLQNTPARSQANFTISAVTSGHGGTYRCYGSRSTSPYLLSHPSDPLELRVSGSEDQPPSTMESGPQSSLRWNLSVLIAVLVALVLLLSLLLFLALRHRRQGQRRTSDASVKDPEPGDSVELDPQQNRQDEDPQGGMDAQGNHSGSRLRQGVATSPSSLSGGLQDTKSRQADKDRQMDSQAAASDTPLEVTYAQLNLLALRRETSVPPSSPSEEPPDEPIVYAALATH